ncbi:MAG: APC family permease [Acidimicrobiales bacterium]
MRKSQTRPSADFRSDESPPAATNIPGDPAAPDPTTLKDSALRPFAVLAIAVAAISPTTSVFLVYGGDLAIAGTGIVWAFLIGAVIAVSMAFCYAEVGSVFPSAGGTYTVVRRALGPAWGGVVNILFLVLGLTATSAILLAAATYLSSLVHGGLPANWVAFAMMVVVTALSLGRIAPTGWVTTFILVLELSVILVFIGFSFANPSLGSNPFTHPVLATPSHGLFPAVGAAAMLAAVVPALFAFNGYDWPLYFAEETRSARRTLPRAVLVAAAVSVIVEVLAVIAATLAIHNLAGTAASSAPLTTIALRTMGATGSKVLIAGVVVAMFDTGLAGNLGYARIFYAAGRDGMWPGPLNRFFSHLGQRSRVPVYGFAVLFVGNSLLCIFSSLNNLITFTGVVIVIVYLLVAVSALVSRVRDRDLRRTLRMPMWPAFPVIALAGAVAALTQQTAQDLAIAFGLAVAAFVVYWALRSRLPGRLERSASDTEPAWELHDALVER